jgi:8-oxo-dGTP pyrophosphatase MutT (NUDIX family)
MISASEVSNGTIHDFTLTHLPSRPVKPYTVVYVHDDTHVLMIKRNDKALMSRHLLGPGGGMQLGETPVPGACRELREETGIILNEAECALRGVFTAEYGVTSGSTGSISPVFLLSAFDRHLQERTLLPCNEGELVVLPICEVSSHPLSPSSQVRFFRHILHPYDGQQFYQGVGWYIGSEMLAYSDNMCRRNRTQIERSYRPQLIRRLITNGFTG